MIGSALALNYDRNSTCVFDKQILFSVALHESAPSTRGGIRNLGQNHITASLEITNELPAYPRQGAMARVHQPDLERERGLHQTHVDLPQAGMGAKGIHQAHAQTQLDKPANGRKVRSFEK